MSDERHDKAVVLVVDDEEIIRLFANRALSMAGYRVLEAEDGIAAQAILAEQAVDVVLTDLRMPRMGGLELMRWARRECPDPVWVILSGLEHFDVAVDAVELGAFQFLTKPLSADALRVTIRNAVDLRHLVVERERLNGELEVSNAQLRQKVEQLERLCGMLYRQAETIQTDLLRAEGIQRALLPRRAPPMEGFQVHAVYQPSQLVGGDHYDLIPVAPQRVALYVADAAGHGLSAALLSVLFNQRIRPLDEASGEPASPTQVLRQVNRALLDECASQGLFVTAVYGLLDTGTGELRLASAGHPPVVVRRRNGERDLLEHTGPALGIEKDARFEERCVHLDAGDRVLMYTDGLCDVGSAVDPLGVDRIAEEIDRGETDAKGALTGLLRAVAQTRGHEANEDDISVLLLEATAGDSTIDNGERRKTHGRAPERAGDVLVGAVGGALCLSIRGRGTWTQCEPLHEVALATLDAGRDLVIDFAECQYLDSTYLGTIHELVTRADECGVPLHMQGVSPKVVDLFDELSMWRVRAHIGPDVLPVPSKLTPLSETVEDRDRTRKRILQAHEVLASLDERNREQFADVIEMLKTRANGKG